MIAVWAALTLSYSAVFLSIPVLAGRAIEATVAGLGAEVIDLAFVGTHSRVKGVGLDVLARETGQPVSFHACGALRVLLPSVDLFWYCAAISIQMQHTTAREVTVAYALQVQPPNPAGTKPPPQLEASWVKTF